MPEREPVCVKPPARLLCATAALPGGWPARGRHNSSTARGWAGDLRLFISKKLLKFLIQVAQNESESFLGGYKKFHWHDFPFALLFLWWLVSAKCRDTAKIHIYLYIHLNTFSSRQFQKSSEQVGEGAFSPLDWSSSAKIIPSSWDLATVCWPEWMSYGHLCKESRSVIFKRAKKKIGNWTVKTFSSCGGEYYRGLRN